MVLAGAGEGPLISTFFNGQGLLLAGFLVAMACYTFYYLSRGTLAGSARFGGYATVLIVEGAVRIAAALVLLKAGVRSDGAYGLAIGLPCLIGLAAVIPRQRGIATPDPRPAGASSPAPSAGCSWGRCSPRRSSTSPPSRSRPSSAAVIPAPPAGSSTA